MTSWLAGPAYTLGEEEVPHEKVVGLIERAASLGVPADPRLWGWGSIRRTSRTHAELAVQTGRAVLERAGLQPDALVLCCTSFPGGPESHGSFAEQVLSGIGLGDVPFTGVTLNRCTNLLVGLRLAAALVESGLHHHVLVLTVDRALEEAERVEDFAVFSDGAAGCVISSQPGGYRVLGSAVAQRADQLDWSNEISAALARQVNDDLAEATGTETAQVARLLSTNLFLPVVTMKERQAGFRAQQLWTGNVSRIGHCFAADPLINLVDLENQGQVEDEELYLLGASVPGSRVGVLLRRSRTEAARAA